MAKKQRKTTNGGATNGAIVRAKNVERRVEQAQDFVSLYTNDTQVQVTPWDVRLIFGAIIEAPTEASPVAVVRRVGEVRMSPQHAKRVVQILAEQLKNYEKSIGAIPLPD